MIKTKQKHGKIKANAMVTTARRI